MVLLKKINIMIRIFTVAFVVLMVSCKPENKAREPLTVSSVEITNEVTIAKKIAEAHGFENWKIVNQIEFRFNVSRDGNTSGRSWIWNPKTNDVRLISETDTIQYNRNSIDSTSLKTDKAFINDKFWLLIPFQLIWDEVDYSAEPLQVAPISQKLMSKITLTYGNEGGYTPGDAYDIYFDKDYLIREWVFRKGNAEEPSMTTTFENYEDFNGIKIAKDHKMADNDFNLFFSNIKVN